jgi:uncharacterized membrane protein
MSENSSPEEFVASAQEAVEAHVESVGEKVSETVQELTGPSSDDKLWALLAYVLSPIVPIIILLMEDKKHRAFLKEHNMQALVAGVAVAVISILLSIILGASVVLACLAPIVSLALWVLMIYYGIQAYNGKSVTIPVVTDFVKKQGWA